MEFINATGITTTTFIFFVLPSIYSKPIQFGLGWLKASQSTTFRSGCSRIFVD